MKAIFGTKEHHERIARELSQGHRGAFAASIGLAYALADSANRESLVTAFPRLFNGLSDRKAATVLAALRLLQQTRRLPQEIEDIATDMGTFPMLDDGEIDALCEEIRR